MNNYSIITLGASGSGKSIFLASLFKVFSTQGKFGFSLDVQNPTQKKVLNQIYTNLTTGEEWPLGTKTFSEWVFTCYVSTPELSKIPACKLTYIDYKGGLVTDISTDEENYSDYGNLEIYIKEADAVLVILDGQKLLSFMQDKGLINKAVFKWIHEDLPNLMQMVDKCNKYTPVHFIISKWDLLEDYYSLKDVKNRLLNDIPEFHNVVGNRIKVGCPVHLIPVSSLGNNFAILDNNGQMKKLLGKIPHPMNVEFPLAFALTDKLHHKTIEPQQRTFKLLFWDWLIIGLCLFLIFVGGLGLILGIVYFAVRWLSRNSKTSKEIDSKTLSSDQAFKQVLNQCSEIKKQFKIKFPEADLTAIFNSNSR